MIEKLDMWFEIYCVPYNDFIHIVTFMVLMAVALIVVWRKITKGGN